MLIEATQIASGEIIRRALVGVCGRNWLRGVCDGSTNTKGQQGLQNNLDAPVLI